MEAQEIAVGLAVAVPAQITVGSIVVSADRNDCGLEHIIRRISVEPSHCRSLGPWISAYSNHELHC